MSCHSIHLLVTSAVRLFTLTDFASERIRWVVSIDITRCNRDSFFIQVTKYEIGIFFKHRIG